MSADLLKSVLFLNIVILDASEAVKQQVTNKIDKMNLPQPFKDAAKKVGGKAASKAATASTVALQMSREMPKKMPQEMAEKGLTVNAECVYQEGPYVVIQLQVQKINSVMMAEVKALENKEQNLSWLVNFLTWLLQLIGAKNQKSLEEEFLPKVVQKQMEPMMNEMLKVKLEEEMKMDAESMVLGEDKQARYFYNKLKEIRAASKKGT